MQTNCLQSFSSDKNGLVSPQNQKDHYKPGLLQFSVCRILTYLLGNTKVSSTNINLMQNKCKVLKIMIFKTASSTHLTHDRIQLRQPCAFWQENTGSGFQNVERSLINNVVKNSVCDIYIKENRNNVITWCKAAYSIF